jgi:hypothetical protein
MKKTSEDMNEQVKGESRKTQFGRFMNLVQAIIPMLVAVFLLIDQFISSPLMRWGMVGMSFILVLVPLIRRWVISRHTLILRKALEIMSACGLDAKIKGNEIYWRTGGQINVLRMNGALIQLSREYELEGAEENVRSMEKAATETMKEVSLAKVIVTRPSSTLIGLSFLTEAFCSSPKSFSEFLPAYIQVLDVAEERQRIHLSEVKPERRRIGFSI